MGHSPGDEPRTLTKCHSYMKTLKGGSLFYGQAYYLKGIKGKFPDFLLLLKLKLLYHCRRSVELDVQEDHNNKTTGSNCGELERR